MWKRPGAPELLAEIAELLEGEALARVPAGDPLQYRLRVAGNLCRILEREARLGADLSAAEAERLGALVGAQSRWPERDLAERLLGPADAAGGGALDADFEGRVWRCLVAIARQRLRIAKPGYDAYDFAPEAERTRSRRDG